MPLSDEAAAMEATLLTIAPGVGVKVMDAPTARQILADAAVPREPEPVGSVRDDVIKGADGEPDLAIRIYEPLEPASPRPVITFLHGGGWVICNLDTHDPFCRRLANESGAVIVSVDYRLAPEARFPIAAEDSYRALNWVSERASELGGSPDLVGVAGDSSGGNLAAVVALMARDRGGPPIAFQVLVYPVTDWNVDSGSYKEFADGGGYVTRVEMIWYWDQYADEADRKNPYASPLQGDLGQLPPALVVTAECDVLRDEGVAYAEKMAAAGTPVVSRTYEGVFHGFVSSVGFLEAADEALADIGGWIRAQRAVDGAA